MELDKVNSVVGNTCVNREVHVSLTLGLNLGCYIMYRLRKRIIILLILGGKQEAASECEWPESRQALYGKVNGSS